VERPDRTAGLYGQVQLWKDGEWVDVPMLCYDDPDRAHEVAFEFRKRHGEYRVDVRDHPDGVPQ